MQLKTERLILREWAIGDIDDLIEGINDLSVAKWLSVIPHPYTIKDAKKWINYCIENSKNKMKRSAFDFAIELKSEKKVIGGVSIFGIDRMNGTAISGGIWLNKKYQGYGYGTEAFKEKIRFGFEVLNLRRLQNGFFKGNKASEEMQLKLGYKIEGLRRKAYYCVADKKIKDEYMTSLLREDWIKQVG